MKRRTKEKWRKFFHNEAWQVAIFILAFLVFFIMLVKIVPPTTYDWLYKAHVEETVREILKEERLIK